jgi:hypothetical protein
VDNLANFAISHLFGCAGKTRVKTKQVSNQKDTIGRVLGCLQDTPTVIERRGHRLFEQDVFMRGNGIQGWLEVSVVRHRNHHGIHIPPRQQVLMMGDGLGTKLLS